MVPLNLLIPLVMGSVRTDCTAFVALRQVSEPEGLGYGWYLDEMSLVSSQSFMVPYLFFPSVPLWRDILSGCTYTGGRLCAAWVL
ncbi:hypothetical protein GE09DRAFT_1102492 [Coniochaeta sp. 2T2.1]|nr:hypothetical protein GE09DRAFT_1102492 [Coniochaeta sp. 2T2.1]